MAEPTAQPIAAPPNSASRKRHKEKSKQQQQQQPSGTPLHNEAAAPVSAVSVAAGRKDKDSSDGVLGLVNYDVEFGDFDYDAVKAEEGAELWLVRAPSSVKAKSLHGLDVSRRVGLVGDFCRKGSTYDVWALEPAPGSAHASGSGSGSGSGAVNQGELGGQAGPVSAEELGGLSVLLPRKRKGGKLYLAPKPVTRHLVVAARPAKPTKPDVAAFENPKREAYPEEVLTHRFRPYGDPGDPPPEDSMAVDKAEVSAKEKERPKRRGDETGSSKKKKAKVVAS